jgi:ketosteroid isomerase-like protein
VASHAVPALEERVSEIFGLLDAMDVDRMTAVCVEDVHTVDEVSRAWRRGRDAFHADFSQLEDAIDDLHTTVGDLVIQSWESTGLVTCVIDQTYMMGEEEQRLTASPTTMVFRLEEGEWRLVLFHSVPVR